MTEELASSLPLIPLAQNPHLPPNVVEWIAERAVDLIVDHVGFPSRYAGDHLTNATSALGELARAGHLIPKQQIERLVQETNAQGSRSGHCINTIKEIGAQVSTDQLETVFEISAPHHWKKLINHPSSTIELQKKLVRKAKKEIQDDLIEKLIWDYDALHDPIIHGHALEVGDTGILLRVLNTLGGKGEAYIFWATFERLMTIDPMTAVWNATAHFITDKKIRYSVQSAGRGIEKIEFTDLEVDAWVKRIFQEFREEFIEAVVGTQNREFLTRLALCAITASHPRVHQAVLEHPDPTNTSLIIVATRTRGETFRRAIRILAERYAKSHKEDFLLFDLLKNDCVHALDDLNAEDLTPLLQSEHREVRMEAIAFIGQLKKEEQVQQKHRKR